jgi:hypothetical protein
LKKERRRLDYEADGGGGDGDDNGYGETEIIVKGNGG